MMMMRDADERDLAFDGKQISTKAWGERLLGETSNHPFSLRSPICS